MLLLESSYGQIVDVNINKAEELESRKKIIEKGDACEREDGVAMLERQVECYAAALKMAKVLVAMEDEVNEEVVKEYNEAVKNEDHTGRDEVRGVEECARTGAGLTCSVLPTVLHRASRGDRSVVACLRRRSSRVLARGCRLYVPLRSPFSLD
jgi:hypothetical protein